MYKGKCCFDDEYIDISSLYIKLMKNNNIDKLKELHNKKIYPYNKDIYNYAIKYDMFDYIKYLHDNKIVTFDKNFYIDCVILNKLEYLKYAHENNFNKNIISDGWSCYDKYEKNNNETSNIECYKYAHKINLSFDDRLIGYAFYKNDYETINYLYDKCTITSNSLKLAIINGSIDGIKKMHSDGYKVDNKITEVLPYNDDIEWLNWLIFNEYQVSSTTLSYAINNNNLNSITWLINNNIKFADLNDICLHNVKLETLKHIYNLGYVFTQKSHEKLCFNKDIECLKFLDEINCPLCEDKYYDIEESNANKICDIFAEENKFEHLKFFHEKGYKIDKNTFKCAFQGKSDKCLNYLYENNCYDSDYDFIFKLNFVNNGA